MSSKKLSNKISVVTTEYNEVNNIDGFIDSLLSQTLKPDEIVIADAGSTDGTAEKIRERIKKGDPLKLIIVKGNRSKGRNAAIKASRNEIIAATDAGCRIDKNWLRNITNPFSNTDVGAVAGFYKVEAKNLFEKATNNFFYHSHDKIDINTWLPSSRSIAFTKSAWRKSGGYPEFEEYSNSTIALRCGGEDTIFDLRLKKAGYKFADGLKGFVYWRPRSNISGLYRQYKMYSLGDGLAHVNAPYFYKLSTAYFIIAALFVLIFLNILFIVPFIFLMMLILGTRVYSAWLKNKGIVSLILMTLIGITFDLAQIAGFWRGTIERVSIPKNKRKVYP
jgi:glycosyltransferase involved in cell wall biosynthesis